MNNVERAERLEEIRAEVAELMKEAADLLDGTGPVEERARAHWFGHIRAALGRGDAEPGSDTTMDRTIEELRGEDGGDAPAR